MRIPLLFLTLAAPLVAQYPADATALRWDGVTSTAGPFCWGFSCDPEVAELVPGESGTLTVRGEMNQIYAIAISLGANRCLELPNIAHGLVLDDPLYIVRIGVCGDPSPILACPSGTDSIEVTIPAVFPPGFSFSIQAIVSLPSGPAVQRFSLTQGIQFLLRAAPEREPAQTSPFAGAILRIQKPVVLSFKSLDFFFSTRKLR